MIGYYRVEPKGRDVNVVKQAYVLTRPQDAVWIMLGWYGCNCDVWEVIGTIATGDRAKAVPHHSYQIGDVGIDEIPFESLVDIVHVKRIAYFEWDTDKHFVWREIE